MSSLNLKLTYKTDLTDKRNCCDEEQQRSSQQSTKLVYLDTSKIRPYVRRYYFDKLYPICDLLMPEEL